MEFKFFDDSVSNTMNVFLIIANIINLIYNIPQMVKTYKIKTTNDFSATFLFMRVIGNTIWLAYSIELNTFMFFVSNVVSVSSSLFISYYKVNDIYRDYNGKTEALAEAAKALAIADAEAHEQAIAGPDQSLSIRLEERLSYEI